MHLVLLVPACAADSRIFEPLRDALLRAHPSALQLVTCVPRDEDDESQQQAALARTLASNAVGCHAVSVLAHGAGGVRARRALAHCSGGVVREHGGCAVLEYADVARLALANFVTFATRHYNKYARAWCVPAAAADADDDNEGDGTFRVVAQFRVRAAVAAYGGMLALDEALAAHEPGWRCYVARVPTATFTSLFTRDHDVLLPGVTAREVLVVETYAWWPPWVTTLEAARPLHDIVTHALQW